MPLHPQGNRLMQECTSHLLEGRLLVLRQLRHCVEGPPEALGAAPSHVGDKVGKNTV